MKRCRTRGFPFFELRPLYIVVLLREFSISQFLRLSKYFVRNSLELSLVLEDLLSLYFITVNLDTLTFPGLKSLF